MKNILRHPIIPLSLGIALFCLSGIARSLINDPTHITINKQTFIVEIPYTNKGYLKGLAYRKSLLAKHGMLFYFDPKSKELATMWMKGTLIPLDMLFIGTDDKIACIIEHTKPLSLHVLSCNKPTRAVLEINAGEVKKYSIKVGDKVSNLLVL